MDLRNRRSLARGGYSARAVWEHQGFPFPLANHKPHSLSVSLHAIDATTQGHGFELISTHSRAAALAAPLRRTEDHRGAAGAAQGATTLYTPPALHEDLIGSAKPRPSGAAPKFFLEIPHALDSFIPLY